MPFFSDSLGAFFFLFFLSSADTFASLQPSSKYRKNNYSIWEDIVSGEAIPNYSVNHGHATCNEYCAVSRVALETGFWMQFVLENFTSNLLRFRSSCSQSSTFKIIPSLTYLRKWWFKTGTITFLINRFHYEHPRDTLKIEENLKEISCIHPIEFVRSRYRHNFRQQYSSQLQTHEFTIFAWRWLLMR